jgi:hypothetical protein
MIVTDGEGFYELHHDRRHKNAGYRPELSEFAEHQTKTLRVVVVRDVYPDRAAAFAAAWEQHVEDRVRTPRANLARGSEWVRLGNERVKRMCKTNLVLNAGVDRTRVLLAA